MVKAIVSSLVAISIFCFGIFFEHKVVFDTFNEFNNMTVMVYRKTEKEMATKEDVLTIQKYWIQKKEILHVFIPHNEIKEIELWLAESSTLIENEKFEDALSKLDVVIELTEQIPKTFLFRIENIL